MRISDWSSDVCSSDLDLIDDSETGELDAVSKADYKQVVDACTLCDMCFMVSCPYVPPHEFNLDFPHLMLRYRAAERKRDGVDFRAEQLTKTDRNGKLARVAPGLVNWAGDRSEEGRVGQEGDRT